ncbi:MAG: HrpB1 family type III secretion system apparatus protein [Chlamydiales bacterium]|nr:HrpB1 family type III secretion system apparatus protein [Chlamydiales bacterium]
MAEQDKLEDFQHDFALLIEAGFVAVKQLDEVSARRLFEAAQILRPESTAPQIGLGYIALNKLEVKEASAIFEEVMQREPDNYLAQAFLGIAYLLVKAKRKKGEELISEANEKSDDPTVKNLCSISLDWAEKDLKKKQEAKAPFFQEAQEEEETKD